MRQDVKDTRDNFGIQLALPCESEWDTLLAQCRTTFTEGLLFHAFKSSADKVALRGAVQKHLKHLKEVPRQSLQAGLYHRVDLANHFKVEL